MARHGRFCLSNRVWVVALLLFVSVNSFTSISAQTASPVASPPSTVASAPGTFLVAPSVSTTGAPVAVAVGDLNSDGKPDLIVANFNSGKVSVLLGTGNGKFAQAVDYPVGKQPVSVVVGDFNGDGKLDVAVVNNGDNTFSLLLGNGDGTLQAASTHATIADPVSVSTGDFYGDGKIDLAIAGGASKTVAILHNDGTGNFSSTPYSIGSIPRSLAAVDIDGDGHLDLATANADGSVTILLSRADGSIRSISSFSVGNSALTSVAAGDFNGDGKTDLAVAQAGTKQLMVLLGKGDGTFAPSVPYTVGNNPAHVVVADVNGDGIPDLVIANQAGNTFTVLLGAGDGTFKPSLDFTVGNSPRAIAVGDFNGDGKLDVAVANYADQTISVPLGNGDGTFGAARAYTTDLERKSIAAGDLDGDGKPDLVVTNYCGTSASCNGNGTVSVLLAGVDGTYKLAGSYALGAGPISVALADVNGDKKLDLIAVNRGDKTVSVLLGNGDGTLQSAVTYSLSASPVALAVGDLNKDGNVDLAIASDCGTPNCSQSGQVTLLLGNGDGSFKTGASYPTGYSPTAIAIGDVDGDGNPDLVVANGCGADSSCKSAGTATVLLSDGKGGFQAKPDVKLGNNPSSLALADLNGDKILDLVVAHRADNKVAVLPGVGDGTFKSSTTYAVGTAPSALVVADFNGDGKRDVAVANTQTSTVSVLFGNGDGTLQTAVPYPVGTGPQSLVAIDTKGSGHADLASANGNPGATPMGSDVTVLKNLAPGALDNTTTDVTLTTGNEPSTYGDPLTFTATITAVSDIGEQMTGSVQFQDNGNSISADCDSAALTIVSNTVATATCQTSTLDVPHSPHTILATYNGDSNFSGSSGSYAHNVTEATPTFTVTDPQPITYGTASITLTGTISAPGPVYPPAGETVKITINGTSVTATIAANGAFTSAAFDTHALAVAQSPYTIQYDYADDGNFKAATDSTTKLTVTEATPAFAVTDPQPITYGTASITLSGTISAPGPVYPPAGETVKITINGTSVTATIAANGAFTSSAFDTHALDAGSYPIQYDYADDGNFKAATDSTTKLTVNKATPTFSNLAPSQTIVYATNSILLFGTISAPGPLYPPPGETISITIGTASGSATIGANGTFSTTFTTSSIPASGTPYTIKYSYAGDKDFDSATDSSTTLTVNKAASSVAVAGNPNPSGYLQSVTFTATVSGPGVTPTGQVSFTDNGVTISGCSSVTLDSNGKGTCTTATMTAGSHSVIATYNGDGNYTGSNGSTTQTVNQATTTTALNSSQNPSAFNQAVTFTAMITGQFGGTPTGTVTFTDSSNSNTVLCDKAALDNTGKAVCPNISNLALGDHVIVATYNGDSNFTTSNNSLTQKVEQSNSTTTVGSSQNPSVVNQSVTFTATVSGTNGGTPSGSVEFTDNGADIPGCAAVTLVPQTNDSTATCATANLTQGNHAIVANYKGDSNFGPSSGTLANGQTVNKATTTTAITSSPNPSDVNQSVTFTATVSPQITGTFSPSGTVSFTDNGVGISGCAAVNLSSGQAQCSTASLTLGTHTIVATYNGDGNFTTSNATLTGGQVVKQSPTTTAVSSSTGNSSVVNQPVTFTAMVTPMFAGSASPSGTVKFTDNGVTIAGCASVTLTGGQAQCATASLALGAHTILATYSGDTNFVGSNGSTPQTVNQATSATTLTSSPNPSAVNQSVTFTATIAPQMTGTFLPTGTVTFTDNGSGIAGCTAVAVTSNGSNGQAVCTTSALTLGTHTIVAKYNGDGNFASSVSSPVTQTVKSASSTTAVVNSTANNPSVINQPVVFTATVTPAFTSTFQPTGTVAFTDNGVGIPGCSAVVLSSNVAQCPTATLAFGAHTIVATYSGDANFTDSMGTFGQTVNTASTTTTVTKSSPNPSVSTQLVTLTASVTPAFTGTAHPSGTVTFTASNGTVTVTACSGTLNGAAIGVATCTTTALPSGTAVTITPTYTPTSTDPNFAGSTGSSTTKVQDFAFVSSPATQVAVAPGYSNTIPNYLFTSLNQDVTGTATPASGFPDLLALSCSVTPAVTNPLTCSINPAALANGGGTGTVTVTAGTPSAPTPAGAYTVTITATDSVVPTLSHSAAVIVTVINNAAPIGVVPGNAGTTTATFVNGTVNETVTNLSCPTVNGSGLGITIPPGGEVPAVIGITCAFGAAPVFGQNGLASVSVTISTTGTATTAQLRSRTGIFATVWFGLPAFVLLGSCRGKKFSRKAVLQIGGTLLVLIALLQVVGCGGGFTRTSTTTGTPTGSYQVLVQGTGATDHLTYSAIVPVNVAHQ